MAFDITSYIIAFTGGDGRKYSIKRGRGQSRCEFARTVSMLPGSLDSQPAPHSQDADWPCLGTRKPLRPHGFAPLMAEPKNVLIMGAAGRDFFNFLVRFKDDPTVRVRAFTATQIPGIESRKFPASLAGPLYPDGIPIFPEEDLPRLIAKHGIQTCLFAYSDVEYGYLGHRIALANAAGADFRLLGAHEAK